VAKASHDGFLTKCGQNHDALLTVIVADITAVQKRIICIPQIQEKRWRVLTPPLFFVSQFVLGG
jgi:hypothetical protein